MKLCSFGFFYSIALSALILSTSSSALHAGVEIDFAEDSLIKKKDDIAIAEIPNASNKIAICFENISGSTFQSEVISLLEKNGMHATFFFDAALLPPLESQVSELVKKGHEIGSMGMGDDYLTILGQSEIEKRIREAESIIEKISGKKPLSFMAPNRVYNKEVAGVLKGMNIPPLGCGVLIDYKPAKGCGDIDIYMQYVISQTHSGTILMVTEKRENLILLRHLLEALKDKRFDAVTLTELGKSSENPVLRDYFSR